MSHNPRVGRRRAGPLAVLAAALAVVLTACGDFSAGSPGFTQQPSLSPVIATPVTSIPVGPGVTPSVSTTSSPGSSSSQSSTPGSSGTPTGSPSSSSSSSSPQSSTTGSSTPADPCKPTDPAVIAACLTAPWGLATLSDGLSALVGERTSGRILKVAFQKDPVEITAISGLDATGDGGLLGLAVSPSYDEDGLIYAYVTTATDNRIIRLARGDRPKAIFTGIPKGRSHNGGPIMFDGQYLYVGTGDTGKPALAANPKSLAGKVLRLDEFGKPVGGSLTPGSAVFSSGLTQPTGMCLLPTGSVGVVDHRSTADLLLAIKAGKTYTTPATGDAAWTWTPATGGAPDCSYGTGLLVNTSLSSQKVTGVRMSAQGAFTGSPSVLLDKTYGRLLTIETGPRQLFWITTSNKDGHGKPVPADDRVIVLQSDGGGGGNGPD